MKNSPTEEIELFTGQGRGAQTQADCCVGLYCSSA